MKILLTTLNARFTHQNLALRYLKAYCQAAFSQIVVREFNINQHLSFILGELVEEHPDIIGFSCYIWNIEQTLELVSNLRKIQPHLKIVLGGPEVSYEYEERMQKHSEIDYVVVGEGEEALLQLLYSLEAEKGERGSSAEFSLCTVPGLIYRQGDAIIANPTRTLNIESIPLIYPEDHNLAELKQKIVYYETSRGCPYACDYCLSSRTGAVRYFPLERCKDELTRLAKLGVEQIRFVDRTFNCNKERALDLLRFMLELDTKTRFQLEMSGDLVTNEMIDLLKQAPVNRFQFEIGVQSTHQPTLERVNRSTDLEKLASVVWQLKKQTKVRFLLDLIAGLPQEGFTRFGESFNFVYNLQPTKIQLGFLKLLRGSSLRERALEFGCVYTAKAPYEVLQTDCLTFEELAQLKVIDQLVDILVNSGRFSRSLQYLQLRDGCTPFMLFNRLATLWKEHDYHGVPHGIFRVYELLWELIGNDDAAFKEMLRLDFRLHENKRSTPVWLGGSLNRNLEHYVIRQGIVAKYLPELNELSAREVSKYIMVESFDYQVYQETDGLPGCQRQHLLFYYPSPTVTRVFVLMDSELVDAEWE